MGSPLSPAVTKCHRGQHSAGRPTSTLAGSVMWKKQSWSGLMDQEKSWMISLTTSTTFTSTSNSIWRLDQTATSLPGNWRIQKTSRIFGHTAYMRPTQHPVSECWLPPTHGS